MGNFDATYSIYNEFQRGMERYWCLRWLQQEKDKLVALPQTLIEPLANRLSPQADKSLVTSRVAGEGTNESLPPATPPGDKRELLVDAIVLRENLVKLTNIPLIFRASSLPELPANTHVQLAIGEIDLLDLDVQTRFIAAVEEVAC
jgi:exoribonuclease-2